MKKEFYVHGTDSLIDLDKEWDLVDRDWGRRFELKHDESMAYWEIYLREDYFKGDCIIKPGDVVVDIGANVGIFTSLALDMGASRVIGYEPHKGNFELAKKNNPNAKIYNLAVSDKKDEELELFITVGVGGHSTIKDFCEKDSNHYKSENYFIKTTTINDIIEENFLNKIDFLKIDTEGAELLILKGLSDENLNKISNISLEYHHMVFNYDDSVYDNLQQRFIKKGFIVFTWILDRHTRMVYISKGDVFRKNPKHSV